MFENSPTFEEFDAVLGEAARDWTSLEQLVERCDQAGIWSEPFLRDAKAGDKNNCVLFWITVRYKAAKALPGCFPPPFGDIIRVTADGKPQRWFKRTEYLTPDDLRLMDDSHDSET
jgi:hypothetical protein